MKTITEVCGVFILVDWIYMKVKYKEWSLGFTVALITTSLFVTAAIMWGNP